MSTLNEKISAWVEPKPPEPPTLRNRLDPASNGRLSERGAWIHFSTGWEAIRWDTDEAANARLLEAMLLAGIRLGYVEATKMFRLIDPDGWTVSYVHPNRKTAVVLAFCKFAGIAA